MSEPKTKPTSQDVVEFINKAEPEQRRIDGFVLLEMFQKITGEKPVMWGSSIIGFGSQHYKSAKGTQEGEMPLLAFSPRKQSLTLYVLNGNKDKRQLLKKLGKHKTGAVCLYINKLADVDLDILFKLIESAFLYEKAKT